MTQSTIKMSQKARAAAKSLAVRYASFNHACDTKDYDGVRVYAWMLERTQNDIGVFLIPTESLHMWVRIANRHLSEEAA